MIGPVGLATVLFVASAASVQKYAGTSALLAYGAVLVAAAPLAAPLIAGLRRRLTERAAVGLAALALAALVVAFAVVYPDANAQVAGSGSDRDDAADIGAQGLLDGRYPYTERTYLDGPIAQFPGGLVLAAPFVALGASAYAAFFWLPAFFVFLRVRHREWRSPLLVTVLALAVSPAVVREVLTGGDLIANGVCVLIATWFVLRARNLPALVAAASFLGFALSWRLSFVFVLPALLVTVAARHGWRRSAAAAASVAFGFTAVTLPFVLHERRFAPLDGANHLNRFDDVVPGGGTAVGLAIGIGAVIAALVPQRWSDTRVFAHAAAVQVVLVLSVVVLESAQRSSLDFSALIPGYGLLGLFFGLAAARPSRWAPKPRAGPSVASGPG
jgi:hypothetical protein